MNPRFKMEGKKLVPQLRFPKFEGEWKEIRYDKLYSFKTTNSLSRDKLNYESGEVKNIHYGDIHTKFDTLFNISNELVPYINSDIDLSRIPEECYLKEGDLVIADASEDYNDIGKCIEVINLNNEKVIAGLHTFLARRAASEIITGFASFLMKTNRVRLNIMKIAQGTKVLSISYKRLGEIDLVVPSIQEQQKIASFLTAVDQRIQALQKKQTLLESYKKGIMQKLFSQEIRFKDEQGKDFPDWEEKKLEQFCNFFSGGTPLSTNKSFYAGEIPFIRSGEISTDKTEQFITEAGLKNSSAKMVEKGDLLMAIYGATSGEVSVSKINGAINQAILCIRGDFDNRFINNWLRSNKNRIITTYLQGGQGNLSAEIVKNIIINLPSLKEQQKIASFLSGIDEAIEKVALQVEKTQEFKKGLLQRMFV